MDYELRVNYSRLWLALISPSSDAVERDRRKYAYLAGNIDDDLYPIFQAAITGRASFSGTSAVDINGREQPNGGGSILDLADQTDEERWKIRKQVVEEGLVESIFDLLRRVPRRILMVLKLNDLTRYVAVAAYFLLQTTDRADLISSKAGSMRRCTRRTADTASS